MKNQDLVYGKVVDQCPSTNDLVKALGEKNYAHGSWISAVEQKAGRGRLGRQWVSKPGNLFLSVLLRPLRKDLITWIPHAIAVGVLRVLREDFPDLPWSLKWPNDIYIGYAKVGGILCESFSGTKNGTKPFVVAGMGINIAHAPQIEHVRTQSLSEATRGQLPKDYLSIALRERIVESIKKVLWHMESEGAHLLKKEYEASLLFQPGDEIVWRESGSQDSQKITGEVEALGDHGELLVWLPGHQLKALYSEEVSIG